ncbi:MAG: 5'-methylthioadenosine/adenosylhomocysteine nucleosidase [Anaerorhabdus sp.]
MIVFIGAMEIEVQAILSLMDDVKKNVKSGIDFYIGKLSNQECIVVKSGIGKTYAAMSVAILMENYDVSGVVNIGTAGGLHPDMKVLDVVISKQVVHHDVDVPDWEKGFDLNERCFFSDKKYLEIMSDIISDEDCGVWLGNTVTGDCFVYREDQFDRINREYKGALCAEMEGAAIAQVCDHYKKPFIIIRSLSDVVHLNDSELTFNEYAKRASQRSAIWCKKFIEKITT